MQGLSIFKFVTGQQHQGISSSPQYEQADLCVVAVCAFRVEYNVHHFFFALLAPTSPPVTVGSGSSTCCSTPVAHVLTRPLELAVLG